MINHLDCIIK